MLKKLIACHDLAPGEARELMEGLIQGKHTPVQMGALLTALRMKGETIDEITAFAAVMRERCRAVKVSNGAPLLDTCGTGGDGWGTFNISTTVAFISAACGVKVTKHGNRAASSRCGSADVLEELGISLSHPPEHSAQQLEDTNFCFLFARDHHPAMAALAPVRKELGVRTIFNLLGPLTNPASATHQIVGIYDVNLVEKVAHVLKKLGTSRALVVNGDGTDEFTVTGPSIYAELRDGRVTTGRLTPPEAGLPETRKEYLAGGDASHNAAIIRSIVEGEKGPRTDMVLINAGAALYVAEKAASISEGVVMARQALESGRVYDKLQQIQKWKAGRC